MSLYRYRAHHIGAALSVMISMFATNAIAKKIVFEVREGPPDSLLYVNAESSKWRECIKSSDLNDEVLSLPVNCRHDGYAPGEVFSAKEVSISVSEEGVFVSKDVEDLAIWAVAVAAKQFGFERFTVTMKGSNTECLDRIVGKTYGSLITEKYSAVTNLSNEAVCVTLLSVSSVLFNNSEEMKNGLLVKGVDGVFRTHSKLYRDAADEFFRCNHLRNSGRDIEADCVNYWTEVPIDAWKTSYNADEVISLAENKYKLERKYRVEFVKPSDGDTAPTLAESLKREN